MYFVGGVYMNREELWFKFILSGSVNDYLKYSDFCKSDQTNGGEYDSIHNGRSGNKRDKYW